MTDDAVFYTCACGEEIWYVSTEGMMECARCGQKYQIEPRDEPATQYVHQAPESMQ